MSDLLRQTISGVLALAAACSLVIGPSPAAVYAEYKHRLDAEDAGSSSVSANDRPAGPTSDAPAQPYDDSESFASFVAPASAKPAQSQWSDTMAAVSGDEALAIAPRRPGRQLLGTHDASPRRLHHPVYRAHAPPIA